MATKLIKQGNYLTIEDTITGRISSYPSKDLNYINKNGVITISVIYSNYAFAYDGVSTFYWSDAQDENGDAFDSLFDLGYFLSGVTGGSKTNSSGAVNVSTQSSTTPLIIVPASRLIGEDELAVATSINDTSITVNDATGITVFDLITVYNVNNNRVFFATVLAINSNTIDLDTPLDFAFPIGSVVSYGDTNLNVDGSVTPVIYGIRNPTGTDINLEIDLTRMIIHFQTSGALDLSKFGDITGGLDNGLICRKKDGAYNNIFNVKTNGELQELMYDFSIIAASGNQQDGATGRFTFQKLGSVIRLAPFEDLQFIVQDDLTSLDSLTIAVQGSSVIN